MCESIIEAEGNLSAEALKETIHDQRLRDAELRNRARKLGKDKEDYAK